MCGLRIIVKNITGYWVDDMGIWNKMFKTTGDTNTKKNGNAVGGNMRRDYSEVSFRCPYCFENIMAKGVAFRSMTAYTPQDLDELSEEERAKKKPYLMAADPLYGAFWSRYPGSKPEDKEGGRRTYERHPVLSPFDDRFLTNAKFTDSKLQFLKDMNGFIYEVIDTEGRRSNVRICSHCHNRLPFEFGKYPIKYIPVVGITSSGKTVYLSQLLQNIKRVLFQAGLTTAGRCPEVEDFIRKYGIRKGGDLPIGTVPSKLTLPVSVNVKSNRDGSMYTLVFYDIAGENCVEAEQMEKYGPFIRNADGILMIVDPGQFSELFPWAVEDDAAENTIYSPDRVIEAMCTAFVSADNADGKATIPLALALSKSDLLKNGGQVEGGILEASSSIFRNIDYNSYVGKGFPYDDWRATDANVRLLLKTGMMGTLLDNSLKQFFPVHSYFAVSALNGKPSMVSGEGEKRRYQMDIQPQTIRVEEPLMWLLHQMGILTPVRRTVKKG